MRASTKVSRIVHAPRHAIYRACLDPDALAAWRVPDGMTARVHAFDGREGGSYRMSLTYTDPADSPGGKTTDDTDAFQGTFIELVPDEKVVELVRFESRDPAFAGEMRMTTSLTDVEEGTEVTVLCENIPPGIRPEDNELGCRLALANLARLVEQRPPAD
ncbi:MAG: SRPBCC family protein [Longimicrobiaceae bacterium]